ncbi:hypothetical protein QQP08_018484 [Theobroma cacao]|nr:hypothetical protein QQP08_018484 [Theobroma cacao]
MEMLDVEVYLLQTVKVKAVKMVFSQIVEDSDKICWSSCDMTMRQRKTVLCNQNSKSRFDSWELGGDTHIYKI